MRQATVLNRLTIAWNPLEGIVAAGSASLIGFGLDSGIEVSAALVLAWRLAKERNDGCQQPADDRVRRLIAGSFAALALYVGITASVNLISGHQPDSSIAGIAIATLSLLVMPLLAADKRRQATVLGSQGAKAEVAQTDVCTLLSGSLLVGLVANAVLDWWWARRRVGDRRDLRSDGLPQVCQRRPGRHLLRRPAATDLKRPTGIGSPTPASGGDREGDTACPDPLSRPILAPERRRRRSGQVAGRALAVMTEDRGEGGGGGRSAGRDGLAAMAIMLLAMALIAFVIISLV